MFRASGVRTQKKNTKKTTKKRREHLSRLGREAHKMRYEKIGDNPRAAGVDGDGGWERKINENGIHED
jgi:hypothetical protein